MEEPIAPGREEGRKREGVREGGRERERERERERVYNVFSIDYRMCSLSTIECLLYAEAPAWLRRCRRANGAASQTPPLPVHEWFS
jgi:hypothetical protein